MMVSKNNPRKIYTAEDRYKSQLGRYFQNFKNTKLGFCDSILWNNYLVHDFTPVKYDPSALAKV